MQKGRCLYWSGEDLRCAFYVLRLPEVWGKYFVINSLVPGKLLGTQREWE